MRSNETFKTAAHAFHITKEEEKELLAIDGLSKVRLKLILHPLNGTQYIIPSQTTQ